MQNLGAGDTLIMHGGTYTLSSYFELDLVGTAAQPITIRAAAGEQPLLHYVDDGQNIVNIADSSFLVIDGVEFSGGSRGIRLTNSSDITIRNCHVHDTAANAISANDGGNVYARLMFVHNEIDHAGDTARRFLPRLQRRCLPRARFAGRKQLHPRSQRPDRLAGRRHRDQGRQLRQRRARQRDP